MAAITKRQIKKIKQNKEKKLKKKKEKKKEKIRPSSMKVVIFGVAV